MLQSRRVDAERGKNGNGSGSCDLGEVGGVVTADLFVSRHLTRPTGSQDHQ